MGWNSTLTRRSPMTRKAWKPQPGERIKSDGKRFWKTPARAKPLKKISKATRGRLEKYYRLRDEFLREHSVCIACMTRGLPGIGVANQLHHLRGRAGRLLCDVRFFAGVCAPCHHWIHFENPTEARELGLLAPASEWNVFPGG